MIELRIEISLDFLRERAYTPSVDDSFELWSWQRARVGGDRSLVLLGASRMLLDIDLATLRARYRSWHVLQLGINGRYPLFTLRDLAMDETFRGVAVISLNAQALESFYRDMQQEYVDYYHQRSAVNNRLNERIGASLQSRMVGLHPLLRLQTLLDHKVRHGSLPAAQPMWNLQNANEAPARPFWDFATVRGAAARPVSFSPKVRGGPARPFEKILNGSVGAGRPARNLQIVWKVTTHSTWNLQNDVAGPAREIWTKLRA